jgi:anti-sigma regulatory factor (Ser/Thr protein kinase)
MATPSTSATAPVWVSVDDFRACKPQKWVEEGMHLRVFPTVEAPSRARQGLSGLASEVSQHSLSDVRAVVSELVAMSVANGARRPIEVSLQVEERRLEGTVHDDGTGIRAVRRRESALVLRILDGLVEEWGADERENRIWFRMSVCPT